MDIEKIKYDFPILSKDYKGKRIVYFDSACMSFKPRQVVEAMNEYYYEYSACAGRSSHGLGEMATKKVEEARRLIARFINAKENEIVFTRNTTEAINLVANSLSLKAGDLVITTDREHNSNLVPWQLLAKRKGVGHVVVRSNPDNTFNLENFRSSLVGAKLVSMVLTSNLDGVSVPAKEIIKIAHENGALVLLDAAQAMAHSRIDVQELDVDFLVFSGHKMLGPTGTGVLYGKQELLEQLDPFLVGGDTVEYTTYNDFKMLPAPEKFEAGLQDYAGIIGLGEAVKYLQAIGFEAIKERELELNQFITRELGKHEKLKIIGPADPALRSGIVNFYIPGQNMHQIALMLDEMAGVMIRSGQHCVHSWFNDKRIENSARISLSFYNSMQEAETLVEALNKIMRII